VMIMFNGYRALIGKIKSSETEEWWIVAQQCICSEHLFLFFFNIHLKIVKMANFALPVK
jgi:hypothetical protein